MRVFIDTNILISAALFPKGVAAEVYFKAVSAPNDAIVSDYVIDEMRSVFRRKFPDRMGALDAFLPAISSAMEVVLTPSGAVADEGEIRDPHDAPILRAAIAGGADVILTGDKDLLESGIERPRISSAGDFLKF
ncbi:MAG: putative toxin-antitoxin system toxin component, PIN family [Atopobiaceae bacterium]|nr:putative toxin-antitoxin system toxin component, PIN family [Atopobiaceae bacterium]